MKRVRVIVIRTAGTNCDHETAFAFTQAGADVDSVHINRLVARDVSLDRYQIIALPGGFTYGDDIASGKILANELRFGLEASLQRFIKDGKLVIGICNGFQILVKAGLLPNLAGNFETIEATLTVNDSAKFEDRWVYLKRGLGKGRCVWTKGMREAIYLPVAHGEGKFIPKNARVLARLKREGLVVFQYVDDRGRRVGYPHNPNGAVEGIAGICDPSGRIFGLMPHPERHISYLQHPYWTRRAARGAGDGLAIFKNGVDYAKKYLPL